VLGSLIDDLVVDKLKTKVLRREPPAPPGAGAHHRRGRDNLRADEGAALSLTVMQTRNVAGAAAKRCRTDSTYLEIGPAARRDALLHRAR
jgi:hypothetical protein